MLEIGSLVDGKYKVLNQIGKGGMSVVYLAMNEKANKQWAIKEVRKDGVKDFEVVKQGLVMETNLLKELRHPHLPAIIDVIETDGTFLIVMDYIEGKPLSDALTENGALPQEMVIDWAKQLCDVLGYLHTRKPAVIYRDMKPANVMLKPDGKITLIDFGTARKFKETNIADTTCLGTIGYAAPEQFGGENQRQTDARTDIYCLGSTLYHLVTGHNPCEPPYEMYPIRYWNSNLSEGLEKIILKCTQKNPDDRYQSCDELLYDLEHYNEIDSRQRRKQIAKLIATGTTLTLTIASIIVSAYGYKGIQQQKTKDYNEVIQMANTYIPGALIKGEDDANVMDNYKKAIEIDPEKSTAYLKIIDYYSRLGENYTQQGIEYVISQITDYADDIEGISEIYMSIGKLYFNGNAIDNSFKKDLKLAYQYFEKVDTEQIPEAEYYLSLAMAMTVKSDWSETYKSLKDFEQYNSNLDETGEELSKKIENYLSLANLYFTNKNNQNLKKMMANMPLEKSIELYEIVLEMIDNEFADTEEKEIGERYRESLLLSLSSSYKLMGEYLFSQEDGTEELLNDTTRYFEKAMECYNKLMDRYKGNDEELVLYYQKKELEITVSLAKINNDFDRAIEQYETLLVKLPDDVDMRMEYINMLVENFDEGERDLAKIEEQYELWRKAVNDADNSYEYFRQKIENMLGK